MLFHRGWNVICYIDDILILGKSEEEHLITLRQVLERLQKYGVHINMTKCKFMQASVEYLRHRINVDGLHTTGEKINAITEAPTPKNLQQLRSFLGLLIMGVSYQMFLPSTH